MKQHRVSTLSVNELDRAQRSRLQQHMRHDELACTAGVSNAFVTAILAFRWPMHFWLWHLVKTFVLVPWRYVRFKATKSELYLLDWCYVVSWLINGLALFAVLVNGAEYGSLNRELVRAGFAMASGPLAWSVFVFRNSLVFHDIDNMTSVFIHLSPAMLFWCIRWGAGMGPGVVNAHWHLFDVCDDYAAADACVQSPDGEPNFAGWLWCDACPAQPAEFLVYPALVYVFGWSIPYFVIILWWLGPWIERSGKEILYDYFKKVQPALCEWFEMRLGPIVGAWACNRYPLRALSICPSLLFFAQAVMFATGPETLPVAERKPFSPGSANAFGSLRLLFANGVGLRCEEKPSASNSRSWGLKH